MAPFPERQLKLAVLAVEKGLATSDQVLTAVARWTADPAPPLVEWLERTGALSGEARRRLEAEAQEIDETLVSSRPGHAKSSPNAPLAALVTPECPERYEFKGEHGRGGQALVYLAFDRHLGREVAWKELSREASSESRASSTGATSLDRFLREARVTGQLEHPGIVPVYELGRRPDGAFYYTMRLIHGRTLSAALKGKDLSDRLRLLGHVRDVCHALAFAHSRGVIHRDVKPANVMVGEFGETVLLDWGIAKVHGADDPRGRELEARMKTLSANSGETLAGDAMGTPSYMSPEQAEGRVADVDERSDVWGLGALLYELLTAEPPFAGPTALATLGQVSHAPLVPVRTRAPEAPPELAAIAEKALAKRREDRYQTASEVASDITAFMSGLRVGAYSYSSLELLRRFAARYKVLLGALAAVFLSVVAALFATRAALTQESAARAAEAEQRKVARYHLAQAYAGEAVRLADEQRVLEARLFAAASLQQNPAHPASLDPDGTFAAREPAAAWLRVDALSLLFQTRLHRIERLERTLWLDESVYRVAFSPDGARLAAADLGGTLTVWSLAPFAQVLSVRVDDSLRGLAFMPDSQQVFTGGGSGAVQLWSLASRSPVRILPPIPAPLMALAVSPSGRYVAAGNQSGLIRLFDLDTGEQASLSPPHTDLIRELAFSPDGQSLASASWDKTAVVWDVATRAPRFKLSGHTDGVYGISFSPDGARLATAAYDRTLRLWDAASGAPLASLDNRAEAYVSSFTPDGTLLASTDATGVLRLFDARTRSPEAAARAHDATGAKTLAIHPGGRLLATGGMDRAVRLWSLSAQGGAPRLHHEDWVYGIAWSGDGRRLATGNWDRRVRLWDAFTHALLEELTEPAGLSDVALSADGRRLASSCFDGSLGLWDVSASPARRLRTLRCGTGQAHSVVFSPDGKLIACSSAGAGASVFDAETGALVAALEHPRGHEVRRVAFSPDGRRLASASDDKVVRLWDASSWTLAKKLEGHTDWASGLAWAPDGSLLASSGKDGQVLLWDPAQGRLLARLSGHENWADDVTFSPDGRLLASAGSDSRAVVWDVATRRPLLRLRTAREATRARFSPDGHQLAVADYADAVLYRLDLPFDVADPAALLKQAQEAAGLRLEGFSAALDAPQAPPR